MVSEKFSGVAFGVSFLGKETVMFIERLGVRILKDYPFAFNSLNDFVDEFLDNPDDNVWVARMFPEVRFAAWFDDEAITQVLVVFVKDTFIGTSDEVSYVLPSKMEPMTPFWLESVLQATSFESRKAEWLYFANTEVGV